MLSRSGASNHPGNNVTTLIASIGLRHSEKPVAPRVHRVPRRHARESDQPFAMIGPSPRQDERPGEHPALLVHDPQLRLRLQQRPGRLHEGHDRHLPVLSVRLAQPRDYAVRDPNTPAFLSSDRTVSVGVAPLASHAVALSLSTAMTAGLARGS